MESGSILLIIVAIVVALFAAYNLFHYILYLLVIHPKDASNIGHVLNDFERRQLIEWTPKADDFLRHDDENRTYDDVFGPYRGENDNYSTCVFPRAIFTDPYESDYALLKPIQQGMRLLDLGCGSGAAADYFASQCKVEIMCVTNSTVQAEICQRKFEKFNGRVHVVVSDFDHLELADEHFDAIYAFESIGYTRTWTPGWRAVGDHSSLEGGCSFVRRDPWMLVVESMIIVASPPSSTIGVTISLAPICSSSSCAVLALIRFGTGNCRSGRGA